MLPVHCLLALATILQGQVHVVDGAAGAGADFTVILTALDAAVDGDIVLVRAGVYRFIDPLDPCLGSDAVVIPGKSLVVLGEQGADVRVDSLALGNLSRGDWALVQGLRFEAPWVTGHIVDNLGPVWIERCTFRTSRFVNDNDALRVSGCDSVVLTRCILESPQRPGILAGDSSLEVFQSTASGAMGAVLMRHASILLSGSRVRGQDGGFGFGPTDGDDALVLEVGSHARIQDSVLLGGSGGPPGSGITGQPGEPLVLSSGSTADTIEGASKVLELSSPVREGAPITVTVRGKVGDLVWLRIVLHPDHLERAKTRFAHPDRGLFLGRIPAGGVLVLTPPAPDLPAGREGLAYFCQATVRDADSRRLVTSSPSALVLLDENL